MEYHDDDGKRIKNPEYDKAKKAFTKTKKIIEIDDYIERRTKKVQEEENAKFGIY